MQEGKKAMTDHSTVHNSSGNVFADLGIEDSDEYMAKSELAAEILRIVQRRRLTQVEAAKRLASASPRFLSCLEAVSMDFPPTGCSASSTAWAMTCRSSCRRPAGIRTDAWKYQPNEVPLE